jgi:hypothetical protein
VAKGSRLVDSIWLADKRPRRGRIEQNGLFRLGPQQLPGSDMSIVFECPDKGSIVTPEVTTGHIFG